MAPPSLEADRSEFVAYPTLTSERDGRVAAQPGVFSLTAASRMSLGKAEGPRMRRLRTRANHPVAVTAVARQALYDRVVNPTIWSNVF